MKTDHIKNKLFKQAERPDFTQDYFSERHNLRKIKEIKEEWERFKKPQKSYIKLKSNTLYCYGNSLNIHHFLNNYL